MKKLIKFLASKIKFIILIYVLIQLVLVLSSDSNYGTDARFYYKLFKQKLLTDSTSLILLFTLFASMKIMITVGTPRYKYPMFILLLPFAANYVENRFGLTKRINIDD
jgi:hypothetical protein